MSNKPNEPAAPKADEVKDAAPAPEAEADAGPVVEDYTDAPPPSDESGPYTRKPEVKKVETDGGAVIETYI